MIEIQSNRKDFEYDMYSLVRAFYPTQEARYTQLTDSNHLDGCTMNCDFRVSIVLKDSIVSILLTHKDETIKYSLETEESNRKYTKNQLKKALYKVLSKHSQKELIWGTLTGIRPTKIPMKLLEEGKSKDEITSFMKHTYFTREDKISLSIKIVEREKQILDNIDLRNAYNVYIGIPFCPSTCLYCSFPSFPIARWENYVDDYLKALEQEIAFTAKRFAHKKLNTIYIGGGTPTTLTHQQMDWLLSTVKQHFSPEGLLEYTVEAGRPDSITKEKLSVLKNHGITRISINPQTMNQETLQLIGRHHTVEQTKETFFLARELGFDNINMDLILGLPGETPEYVKHTMEEIKKLRPDSLTVHSLAMKRAAHLMMWKDQYESFSIINTQDLMETTHQYAEELGLFPYYLYRQKNMAGNLENVGYAKEGKAGIYNILIMEEKQSIIALGAGGASKFVFPHNRIERIENVKDVRNYITRVDEMIERKRRFCNANQL